MAAATMSDGDIYRMEVTHTASRQQLVTIAAERETVLDVALRVMLDAAPLWSEGEHAGYRPTFDVTVWKVTRR
jgi:hypothetical protein